MTLYNHLHVNVCVATSLLFSFSLSLSFFFPFLRGLSGQLKPIRSPVKYPRIIGLPVQSPLLLWEVYFHLAASLFSCSSSLTVSGMLKSMLYQRHWFLRWRVSKLIFARAQNNHFQNGILQSQIVANVHRNYLSLMK